MFPSLSAPPQPPQLLLSIVQSPLGGHTELSENKFCYYLPVKPEGSY